MIPTKTLSALEARQLLEARASEFEAEWASALDEHDTVALHEGSLTLSDFSPNGAVVVAGDLAVAGALFTGADDLLIVLGNVSVETADLRGQVLITGDLHATSWVYVNSGNDYPFGVGERLTTKVFVEEGMASFAGTFECVVWRTMNVVSQLSPRVSFERRPNATCTRSALREAGLLPDEIETLSECAYLEGD